MHKSHNGSVIACCRFTFSAICLQDVFCIRAFRFLHSDENHSIEIDIELKHVTENCSHAFYFLGNHIAAQSFTNVIYAQQLSTHYAKYKINLSYNSNEHEFLYIVLTVL